MTHLLLLTKAWPSWPGEEFLTAEVRAWETTGTQVTVMPLRVEEGNFRHMPASWQLDLRLAQVDRGQRRAAAMRAAFHPRMTREATRILFSRHSKAAVQRQAASTMREALLVQGAIEELHQERPIDLVYTYWFDTQTLGSLLAQVAPVITRAHNYDLYEGRSVGGYAPFKRWMGPQLAMFAGISHQACQYAVSRFKVPPERAWFSPLGVDRAVPPTPAGSPGRVRVVSIGALTPVKRPVLAAATMTALARLHPEWEIEWRHAGAGPLAEQVLAELRSGPANLTAELLGQLAPEDLELMLADGPIDLILNTSSFEGVPVSIMQAMARGIPALASDVGATHELVTESVGRCVPADLSPTDMAAAISANLSLARDPSVRRRCREAIALHWDARTNYLQFAERVLALAPGSRQLTSGR